MALDKQAIENCRGDVGLFQERLNNFSQGVSLMRATLHIVTFCGSWAVARLHSKKIGCVISCGCLPVS